MLILVRMEDLEYDCLRKKVTKKFKSNKTQKQP